MKMGNKIFGLIPAGGQATRLGPLPCSKELLPVGFQTLAAGEQRPKVACHYLLEKMRLAGIEQAYIILRHGKWDIPAYFRHGGMVDMHLAYLLADLPYGTPYTLDQAFPFIGDAVIALGFPDILFTPDDAFTRVLDHQKSTGADIVLGLFPGDQPHTMDMVELGPNHTVKQIEVKPHSTDLKYTWGLAAWGPRFTRFMHEYLAQISGKASQEPELYVGNVIQAALERGFKIEAISVSDEPFLDIGTPDNLAKAVKRLTESD